ncbi:reprolysin-like metallopeptidase [Flavobacterium rhizosphaerae]|uniref:Reprolysin-like metallopeptidase n=1 Tax=Flavobacterium rhizosphaerae TaxID=3163298 RepID=A0ABW8YV74_9FLAO
MKKALLFFITSITLFGHAQNQFWQKISEKDIVALEKNPRDSHPESYTLFKLDLTAIKTALAQAPVRNSGTESAVVLQFPDGDGNMLHFRIYNAPVIHKDLAAKYPGTNSYIGQCIEHPSTIIRFSVTLFGLHTMALSPGDGTWYIDPYTKDANYYMVYKRKGLQTPKTFTCLTQNNISAERTLPSAAKDFTTMDAGNFRIYRLAIVTTVEYSAFHIAEAGLQSGTLAQKKAAVIAAIAVTVTRVNSMFERDLSVSLELIANNDEIVFINNDELTNNDAGALLNEGNAIMYDVIGADNFDMGHSFGTAGGGLAAGAPCSDFKGGAMTGIGSPVGDPFDIDYVSHEMGHQFGAPHTFNAECGGNRADDSVFEPGGGTTIMAYAGVCDPVIQWSSDAQFHAKSIESMRYRINGESNCVALIATGNTPPVANAGSDYVIPIGTAFILEGTATDADGDALTYDWEQINNEISVQPPVPNATVGPNFRSLPISESPNRFMPRIEEVLNNNLFPTWEVIPTVSRELDFAFTVRDNNINGGESTTDYMHIDVAGGAGPFVVTSPNTAVSWQAATNKNITWNIAGTTSNGVNTPYVDIFLSTDGGYTYPVVLATMVPNDGSETVLIPNVQGTSRVMVRGHNNIFYDISNTNFTISSAGSTFVATVNGAQNKAVCKGNAVTYAVNYEHINGFNGITTLSASGLPEGAVASFSPSQISANGTVQVTITTSPTTAPGLYAVPVTMTSGDITKTITVYVNLLDSAFETVALLSPENDAETLPTTFPLEWESQVNASYYVVEVATDAAFENIIFDTVTVENTTQVSGLLEETQYYWRVMPANDGCEGSYSAYYSFITGAPFCNVYVADDVPVGIPFDDVSTVSSLLGVADDFIISAVEVSLDISHTWIGDVTVTLISPAGTEVVLFNNQCGDQDNVLATFSDEGGVLSCGGTPAITGILSPNTPFSQLNGENSGGLWRLEISDNEPWDGGSLNNWSIALCGQAPANLGISAPDAMFDFVVYPNPNSGNFSVRFTSQTDSAAIKVYDIRGRLIYTKQAVANGTVFNEDIKLDAEAGVYLVNVESGGRVSSKKIILN